MFKSDLSKLDKGMVQMHSSPRNMKPRERQKREAMFGKGRLSKNPLDGLSKAEINRRRAEAISKLGKDVVPITCLADILPDERGEGSGYYV